MLREKAAELTKELALETDERKALALARIAICWLDLAETEERANGTSSIDSSL